METLQEFLIATTFFINYTIIPLLFGIAILFFLWNTIRYFIIGGGDKAGREKARRLALYGVIGFVIMVGIWGIVNAFLFALDLYGADAVCPDYIGDCGPADSGGYFSWFDYFFGGNSYDSSTNTQFNGTVFSPEEFTPGTQDNGVYHPDEATPGTYDYNIIDPNNFENRQSPSQINL